MAAAAVDVGYLAASYAVPETTLNTLLDAPTVELVQSLLVQIEAKAREHDDLKSEKLRSDVELEAAIHNADTRVRTLKATADKAERDVDELRQKLAQQETARQQTESQLQTLQAETGTSTARIHELESRVKSLEAQNRDAVALHEAKSAAYDSLAADLSAQHQKLVELRKHVSELEEKNQALENAATGVKFRETNFQQEIDLLRKNNEWFEGELKTRAADNTKFRKEKNAQIAELQRANADAAQTIDSLRSKESSQTKRIEELEQRVESALLRIQHLQEEAAQKQESFRAELDDTRRLAALQEDSANTHRKRREELQAELASTRDQAAEEIGRLQAEVESERNKAAEYESRVAELETLVESQEAQLSELRNSVHAPATPRRPMNGSLDTPGRASSPVVFSPGGSRLKGALSATQLYTENTKLKATIRALEERDEQRTKTLDEMLEELESRQPEIEELQQENERLTAETGEISALLEEAIKEKEVARKETRKLQGDYQGLVRQKELDRQLIRDATFQSKLLLYQQKRQEQGLEALSQEEQQYLNETAYNEIPDHVLDEDDTATSRLISKHLVLFRDIGQLVDKNHELLRTIREVAEQYEGSEAQSKAKEQEKNREELSRLREKVSQYEDEIKSLNLRSQSFMKERDMYRRIVTSRGHGPPGADAVSLAGRETATPEPGNTAASVEQSPRTQDIELIKELQTRLDLLKEESATDRTTFKQQVDDLAKENRQLQTENTRLSTKQEMAQQRYDYQQHRITSLETEKVALQQRYDSLQDELARSDVKKQQAMEDLVEAKSQIDGLERENTNLKASQTLWKTIEARLIEDKNNLAEDKARLSKIISDMQTLRNEHDLAEAQNRRNLQVRADTLEADLQNTRRKLDEEIEDRKKTAMRNEWEQTEKQRKIDDLLKAANEVRQELASVKTARDQLQSRVNELQTELLNAKEHSQSLETEQAPRPAGTSDVGENGVTQEEELTTQLAELRRDHERLQEQLELANSQIEAYKEIAQDAEESLQNHVDSQEQAEQEMTRLLDEKDATITDLKQRVEEISSELATTNTELSQLRGTHEQEVMRLNQQKEVLEVDIARLKEEVADYKAEVDNQKQHVVSQAEIAKTAQLDYENELAKHGETMKNLRTLRAEHGELRTEIAQYKSRAEAATASLAQSEEHWASARERYDRELAEARTRYNDLNDRHKTLYEQFDGLNAQLASLQNNRVTVAAGQSDASNFESGLHALNKSLRDDKDILQLQLNTKELELQRVRQELNYKQEQLDQVNERLITEQAQAQSRHSGANLQALQENIQQLNLYRESNTTLRNDVQRLEAEREKKNKEIEDLHNKLQPLQTRVMELEGELEINTGHLRALEEDRDRWQKRHQDVLQRYDRIDPKELEDLKKRIEELQTERDGALQQANGIEDRIQAAKAEAEAEWATRREKIVSQAKERARADKEKKDSLTAERDQLQSDLNQVKGQLEETRSQLDAAYMERDEAIAKVDGNEEGQVSEPTPGLSPEDKERLEHLLAEEVGRASAYLEQVRHLQKQKEDFEQEINNLKQRIDQLNKELTEAQSQKAEAENQVKEMQARFSSPNETVAAAQPPTQELEKLKEELDAARKEADDLRTRADMVDTIGANTTDDTKPVAEQVAEQLAAERAALQEREAELARAEAEVQQLKADLEQRSAQLESSLAEAEAEVQRLRADLEQRSTQVDSTLPPAIEAKMEKLKKKANEMLNNVRKQLEEKTNEVTALQQEIEGQRQQIEELKRTQVAAETGASENASATKAEPIPDSGATEREIQDWVSRNPVTQAIIKRTIQKRLQEAKAEQEKSQDANEPSSDAKAEQEMIISRRVAEATAIVKVEHEKMMTQKIEGTRAQAKLEAEKRFAAKESLAKGRFNKLKAQWDVVEAAAAETPEKPVKEVYEIAKNAKPAPQPPQAPAPAGPQGSALPPTPTEQPTQTRPSEQTVAEPAFGTSSQQQPQPASSGIPQANGAKPNNPFSRTIMGQPNALVTSGQAFPNQMGGGFGFGGGSQPSFATLQNQQAQFNQNQGRPISPFAQQQMQQQGGRGLGDVGTGPAALRNIVGQQGGQSGIPRGGASGIPVPGGRGRGIQTHQNQGTTTNAPGAGNRPGSRAGGRGRGGQAPASPLNPGAANFQPGGGRGQKRGAEDDGGGRGGKRQRGGRGGAGGGAPVGGGEE